MAITTTAVAAGALDKVIADSVIAFNEVNVMFPLISSKQAPMGSLTAQWSDYTKVSSGSVAETTEGSDHTTVTSITSAARSMTAIEHVIRADLTDMSVMGSTDDLTGNTGDILGNAVAAKLDADLVGLFSGFSQTSVGAGTALSLSGVFDALRQLRGAGAPAPYNLVMSDQGIWGDKGLRSLLVQGGNTGTNAVPHSLLGAEGQEFLSRGFVDRMGNIDIYFCNEISDDVASGGDSASGMFSAGAIGLAVGPKGLYGIEPQRDASARATEYVATGIWKAGEVKNNFGVYILHDVS
jgi:hypothetical protein